jgi:uncharacterized protein
MGKEFQIYVSPEHAKDKAAIEQALNKQSNLLKDRIEDFIIIRRSIDARAKNTKILLKILVFDKDEKAEKKTYKTELKNVVNAPRIIIIGAGPAGLFAALKLISLGLKPIILERGKDVRERRKDLASINLSMQIQIIVLEKEVQEHTLMENFIQDRIKEAVLPAF